MAVDPLTIYANAVRDVPFVKWAMAVAGVVAAGAIVLMLVHDDPRKAVITFLLLVAAMLIMVVVSGTDFPGPRNVIVWTITIVFVAALAMTFTAYATGCPRNWAQFVGANPNCPWPKGEGFTNLFIPTTIGPRIGKSDDRDFRSCFSPLITTASARVGMAGIRMPFLRASLLLSPHDRIVPLSQQTVDRMMLAQTDTSRSVTRNIPVRHSSNDCAARSDLIERLCLGSGVKANPALTRIEVNSANCGSTIQNPKPISGSPNCVTVDVHLRGCGYDTFLGLKNCKGRGWVDALVTVTGTTQ